MDPAFDASIDVSEEEVSTEDTTEVLIPNQPSAPIPHIFEGYLNVSTAPTLHPGVTAALAKLFEYKDLQKVMDELTQHYPEPEGLHFLTPEPLADAETHLRTIKSFFALKADSHFVKLAETQALMARPLADAMSYIAEASGQLDPQILAERLSDTAKALVMGAKLNEVARIDLVCSAFKVPTSAAKTERGTSLLGPHFAKHVERLRKDKKVLLGDEASTSSYQRPAFRPYNRGPDRAAGRRSTWRQLNTNSHNTGPYKQQQHSAGSSLRTGHNVQNNPPGPSRS